MTEFNMDALQIECAHCGSTFSIELTQCPNCGISLYPLEDDPDGWAGDDELYGSPEQVGFWSWLGTLAFGWLVAAILSISLYALLRSRFFARSGPWVVQSLNFACVALGVFLAGLVIGRSTGTRPYLLSILVALCSLSVALLLTAYETTEYVEVLLSPFTLLGLFVIFSAALMGVYIAVDVLPRITADKPTTAAKSEEGLYQDLLIKVRFNNELAERLVEYERKRTPDADRKTLLENAIWRWERDNR